MQNRSLQNTNNTSFWATLGALVVLMILSACGNESQDKEAEPEPLKVYNQQALQDFKFVNQDSQKVDVGTVYGKVHVMDFFFTSCPTICPRMKSNMLTVYEKFQEDDRVVLVSHSIDTRHDSVPVLREYAERLEVGAPRWHFVTGEKEDILGMAKNYMVAAMEDSLAPGGYAHSGKLILLDQKRNIRGYYDGTSAESTEEMMVDMERLLNE